MSIESDFRTLLANNAGVAALVGGRIALNSVPEGSVFPLIVFSASHERTLGLDNSILADICTLNVQCWANTAAAADQVADAAEVAIATATPNAGAVVTSRSSEFDAELGLDATILDVEWWG